MTQPNRMRSHRPQSGFTLVELLVATAITAILVILLLGISQNILESHRRTISDATLERDAQFALDRLAEDLGTLTRPRLRGAESLHAVVESVAGAVSLHLVMVTNATDSDPDGVAASPRAISYRVAYQDPVAEGGGWPAFAMYRSVATATETFQEAVGASNLMGDFWQSRPSTQLRDYLIGNVVDFRLRYLDTETSDWVALDNPGDVLRLAGRDRVSTSGLGDGGETSALELSITTLSREGGIRLRDGAVTVAEAIDRYGKTHTRRVGLAPGRSGSK